MDATTVTSLIGSSSPYINMTSLTARFVTDPVGVENTTVFVDVTTKAIDDVTSGYKTEVNDVQAVTSLTFTGVTTSGVVTSTAMSSQTFAIIVGCSVAAVVLLALIILIAVCWFVRPVIYRRNKSGSRIRVIDDNISPIQIGGQETVFDTSGTNSKSSSYAMPSVTKPQLDTMNNDMYIMPSARPTFANNSTNGVTTVNAQNGATARRKASTPHAESKPTQPPVGYCSHGNFYYSGPVVGARTLPGDGDSQYDGSVSSLGDASGASLGDSYLSLSSTTPLHQQRHFEHRPPRKQSSRDKSDDRLRKAAYPSADGVSSADDATRATDIGRSRDAREKRRLGSQKSVKSLTEDVWNSTVDMAFDSALSLYEPS